MKIGSKLAIYKIDKVFDGKKGKIYKATVIENIQNFNNGIAVWEQHFFNGVSIHTDLELEEAKFDIELEEYTITYKSGKSFTKKPNQFAFERISNPEHSVIRVLDFAYNKTFLYDKKRNRKKERLPRSTKEVVIVKDDIEIYDCEYDKPDWCLPEKHYEKQIKYYIKQHNTWKEKVSTIRKENTQLKKELAKFQSLINKPVKKTIVKKVKPKKQKSVDNSAFIGFE